MVMMVVVLFAALPTALVAQTVAPIHVLVLAQFARVGLSVVPAAAGLPTAPAAVGPVLLGPVPGLVLLGLLPSGLLLTGLTLPGLVLPGLLPSALSP